MGKYQPIMLFDIQITMYDAMGNKLPVVSIDDLIEITIPGDAERRWVLRCKDNDVQTKLDTK